jgi:cellulose synthase/poly-beta-1,6-N-acetylglucosamine synthase-like glycosyltransferase
LSMGDLLDATLVAVAIAPAAWGAWWLLLATVALPAPRPLAQAPTRRRLIVVSPAHNEAESLPTTLESLAASTVAAAEVVVVADNCTDGTAGVARRFGATTLVRNDDERRGKAYALDFALAHLRMQARAADVVVFVDADTVVAPDCLAALELRVRSGAAVVQAHYQADAGNSELGRLRRLAFALVHWARPLGASRLGLGCTLKGNGMAFDWSVIEHGTGGEGITEDAAMTLALVARGIPVAFEPRARVSGLMAESYSTARTQDARWEGGRASLLVPALRVALVAAYARRWSCAAGAMEVASPPLAVLVMMASTTLGVAFLIRSAALPVAIFAVAALGSYVCIGFLAARVSPRDLLALRGLPGYLWYKLVVYNSLIWNGPPRGWQRTQRGR